MVFKALRETSAQAFFGRDIVQCIVCPRSVNMHKVLVRWPLPGLAVALNQNPEASFPCSSLKIVAVSGSATPSISVRERCIQRGHYPWKSRLQPRGFGIASEFMQTTGNRPPPSNQANGSVVSAADLCVIWEESGLLRRSDSGHETSADAVELWLIYLIVTGLLNQALVFESCAAP